MGVHRGVPRGSGQIFSVAVGNVLASLGLTVPFCEAEVDDIDIVLFFAYTNEEIVRFDVTMEEMP